MAIRTFDLRTTPTGTARRAAPFLLAVALAVLAIGGWGYVIAQLVAGLDGDGAERREDVVAYYAAGAMVADGRGREIYDADAVAEAERGVLGRPAGRHGGLAYMNPPFVAGLFQPLSALSYQWTQVLWFGLTAIAVLVSLALLLPELRGVRRRWALVFVLAVLASFPVFWSLIYGQISPLLLLSWALSYRWLKRRREGSSGMALAATLIKPHLALVPVLYLLATGRWRAVAGFAAAGAALAGVSVALTGVEATFVAYPRFLLQSLRWTDEYGVDRTHMFGWHSFFLPFFDGASAKSMLVLVAFASALTLLLALLVWRRHRQPSEAWRPVLALAAATVLTSPHIHAQDLLLLVLPAAVLVASRRDALAVAVPGLLFFLIPVAVVTSVNLATPFLAAALVVAALPDGWLRADALARAASWLRSPPRAVARAVAESVP